MEKLEVSILAMAVMLSSGAASKLLFVAIGAMLGAGSLPATPPATNSPAPRFTIMGLGEAAGRSR